MFKTLLKDRETIENKYHLQSQPYNHYDRWSYHGYDFDPETGLECPDNVNGEFVARGYNIMKGGSDWSRFTLTDTGAERVFITLNK